MRLMPALLRISGILLLAALLPIQTSLPIPMLLLLPLSPAVVLSPWASKSAMALLRFPPSLQPLITVALRESVAVSALRCWMAPLPRNLRRLIG